MKDLIERSDVIDEISHITPYRQYKNGKFNLLYLKREVIKAIKAIPVVEPKQGEWIKDDIQRAEDTDNGNYRYTCSICGHSDVHAKTQEVPYCWWCGSRMRGADDKRERIRREWNE